MSFINLSNELFETTTFNIKPQIHFISSSKGEFPASGSAYVAPIRSKCIRNLASENVTTINLQESGIPFSEGDFKSLTVLKAAKIKTIMSASIYSGSGLDISDYMSDYLNISNDAPKDIRFSKFLDVFRFDPPLKFNLNHVVKRNINNVLNPYHKNR